MAASSAPPVRVELTPGVSTTLPAPGQPNARVVLTISQPRLRGDGRLASVVRIRVLELPRHRSYFLRLDYGAYHAYLCGSKPECPATIRWLYSRRELAAMRRHGVHVEAFVHTPGGNIWSVAGGRIDGAQLASLVVRS
jgi:hypothetical protein